jgi:hypothetical protein
MEIIELTPAEPVEMPVPALSVLAPCTAELAECTCPDFCERDHTNE